MEGLAPQLIRHGPFPGDDVPALDSGIRVVASDGTGKVNPKAEQTILEPLRFTAPSTVPDIHPQIEVFFAGCQLISPSLENRLVGKSLQIFEASSDMQKTAPLPAGTPNRGDLQVR
jgi:hypothetical protein